jgi:HEAT repeat protein
MIKQPLLVYFLCSLFAFSVFANLQEPQKIYTLTQSKGKAAAPELLQALKNPSWEVRLSALKSLTLLHEESACEAISNLLLKDPSLIIRTEAALALSTYKDSRILQSKIIPALIKSLYDGKNYRSNNYKRGNSDWVPTKALLALRILNAKSSSQELLPLLKHTQDKKLKAHTLFTLEQLENIKPNPKHSFDQRLLALQTKLKSQKNL